MPWTGMRSDYRSLTLRAGSRQGVAIGIDPDQGHGLGLVIGKGQLYGSVSTAGHIRARFKNTGESGVRAKAGW